MEHRVKVTVLDKKIFPELQAQYCAVPDSGKCPCYNVGDEFLFFRNDERDDFWHMGLDTISQDQWRCRRRCRRTENAFLL